MTECFTLTHKVAAGLLLGNGERPTGMIMNSVARWKKLWIQIIINTIFHCLLAFGVFYKKELSKAFVLQWFYHSTVLIYILLLTLFLYFVTLQICNRQDYGCPSLKKNIWYDNGLTLSHIIFFVLIIWEMWVLNQ